MDMDFGYNQNGNGNDAGSVNANDNGNQVTDIDTGGIKNDPNGVPADDITVKDNNDSQDEPDIKEKDDKSSKENDKGSPSTGEELIAGTAIEVGEDTYTVDEDGNIRDKNGNIFKEASEAKAWIESFDKVEEGSDTLSISAIQEAVGIDITGDDNKPIEFENTPAGVKAYIDAVVETAREEHYNTAINTLYQKYPILNDVINYYVANGNSLEGFGELPDRSNITIDDTNEQQQEAIIRAAWSEQKRKGDVEGYIQYLKSSGTLLATAQEELAGMQEADAQYREELRKEAERKENEHIKELEKYWNGVHEVIKTKQIAGYQIPDNIIISRDGQKLSVTPNDFFNYIYRVDDEGKSAYERDLEKETPESRRDDEILRAYLKFVGGNYSNLVSMAINKEKVNKLKLKAKERTTSTVRITKPKNTTAKGADIDLGYN